MSNIIYNNIDVTFPIAGQDNPSKGFRDNWSSIQNALSTAKSEITTLETAALLRHDLQDITAPAENDLAQSTIVNGSFKEFYSSSRTLTPASTAVTIPVNVADGDIQQINLVATAVNIMFTGWPAGTQYGKVRLHLTTISETSLTINTVTSQAALDIKFDIDFPSPLTVTTNVHKVIDVWSFNNGVTVFVKYIGEF